MAMQSALTGWEGLTSSRERGSECDPTVQNHDAREVDPSSCSSLKTEGGSIRPDCPSKSEAAALARDAAFDQPHESQIY
eukprot:m.6346 g.6346  ORF g.6346 m.6346 type:complete len:79 (-) comp8410_c0_seq1:100-336(-)